MAFSGGVFSRLYNWVNDRDAAIKILASRMDAEMDGMATGLSTCLLKDGTQTVTANIPMATYKFTGLGAGTGAGESVRYEQVVLLSAGANQIITRSAAGTVLTLESTDAGATAGPNLVLHRNSASPIDNDIGGSILFDFDVETTGTQTTFARIKPVALDTSSTTEDGSLIFGVITAGSLADELILTGANLYPNADDGLALGLSGTAFSDLFLASGSVINFNAGNVTVTHSAGLLTSTGNITISNANPTLTLIDTDTGADNTITGASTAGSLTLSADVNNEVANSGINFLIDGSSVGSLGATGNICRIFTSAYTGDGATSQAITGVGFTPKYVKIWTRNTASGAEANSFETTTDMIDDNASGMAIETEGTADTFVHRINGIITLGADGFTVDDAGIDAAPNKSGEVYNYLCLG